MYIEIIYIKIEIINLFYHNILTNLHYKKSKMRYQSSVFY